MSTYFMFGKYNMEAIENLCGSALGEQTDEKTITQLSAQQDALQGPR